MVALALTRRLVVLSVVVFALFGVPRLILLRSPKIIPVTLTIHGVANTSATTNNEDNSNHSKQKSPSRPRFENNSACDISTVRNNTICCDRSDFKSDVCIMRGDVRMQSSSSAFYLHCSSDVSSDGNNETIKPYPRKWETTITSTVEPLNLVVMGRDNNACDVHYDVPALVFYTGGYTGNLYHDFLDGIVPLYISAARFEKKIVFVIIKYQEWWFSKYRDIVSALSAYPPMDFLGDRRVHCFPGAVVGLQVHEELAIDPGRMRGNNAHNSILHFRAMLEEAYKARVEGMMGLWKAKDGGRPRLVILSRSGSRRVENEEEVVGMGREVGFEVEVVSPKTTTDLAFMYWKMNATDMVVGVHGAAFTHFLFMRPGAVLVQIVPLGLAWAAETCFGKAAGRMGLRYMAYEIEAKESSLYDKYPQDDPILTSPGKMSAKGWEVTKDLYLEQTVKLDLGRFRKILVDGYDHLRFMKTLPSDSEIIYS